MSGNVSRWQNRVGRCAVATAFLLALGSANEGAAQDQLVTYFSGTVAGVGNLSATTFDANGDFWVISNNTFSGPVPVPRISKVEFDGQDWDADPHVLDEDLRFFYRSSDAPGGITHPLWGGPSFGTPNGFLLNPAPLTIDVPTSGGGTQQITYQPGEIAFISDAMGVLSDENSNGRHEHTKKIWRYDLRKVDNPNPFGTPVSGPTSQQPDFNTASNGDGTDPGDLVFGAFGFTDWNDAMIQVVSEQDLRDAAGGVAGSDNFGRSFAWSSDGQSIYAIDAGSNTGGIYKVDASEVGVVERIRTDVNSNSELGTSRIITEPAVVHTSVFDFDQGDARTGDQIIVMGSNDGGNQGGLNVYLDDGTPGEMMDPFALFTEADFRDFAEYIGTSKPQYTSVTSDDVGNLYFTESRTDGVFRYDTQGRFVKVLSEREHNEFQIEQGFNPNDNALDLQHRMSNGPGFQVPELIFTDDALDSPLGVYVFEIGDFDRDNDVDSDDYMLFGPALRTRGTAADDENLKFDLNGNSVLDFNDEDMDGVILEQRSNTQMVVDWKDVKILQQFGLFPNGDTNFDGALDFTDLDTVNANYYTNPGQTEETWIDGDFASIDPDYIFDAVDANLVNEVDLAVFADAWLNDLGQPAPSEQDLINQGYSGQFLTDVIAAFNPAPGVPGDYDGDGDVDSDDYTVWNGSYGQSGAGLAADGNGDGVVDAADFTVWRDALSVNTLAGDFNDDGVVDAADYTVWRDALAGSGALANETASFGVIDAADYAQWASNFGATAPPSVAVPEPASLLLASLLGLLTWPSSRKTR